MAPDNIKSSSVKILEGVAAAAHSPRIIIELETLQKLKCFIDLCPYEISGLGIVEALGDIFFIKEVFLLPQITADNCSYVELDSKALNRFVYDLVKIGKDPSQLTFQWHSHAYSPVFFSPTDVKTIQEYLCDYMISLVINKFGEYRLRFDLFRPCRLSLYMELWVKIPTWSVDFELARRCRDEITSNVRIIKVKPKDSKKSRKKLRIHGQVSEILVPVKNALV